MGDLLGSSFAVAEKDRLYCCLDHIVEHQAPLFDHLRQCWQDLFQARFDILLYDLTSTYIEGQGEEIAKAQYGYSRDHRFDCREVVIALLVTPVSENPSVLWECYIQLTQVEAAFRALKSELGWRPIYHQVEKRVEAHIFVAFLAYALWVTLKQRLMALAPGLTPRAGLEKLARLQTLDVCLPTTDGRWLIMPRHTQPEPDQSLQGSPRASSRRTCCAR